jgi:hypothetical protein
MKTVLENEYFLKWKKNTLPHQISFFIICFLITYLLVVPLYLFKFQPILVILISISQ